MALFKGLLPLLLCLLGMLSSAQAEVQLPAIISSNMVLQRDQPVKIWGTASPGEKIAITMGSDSYEAETAANGTWSVTLKPMKAGPVPDITISASNTIQLTDLLAGDVWVCTGQGNMEMTLTRATSGTLETAPDEIATADYPQMRFFQVRTWKGPAQQNIPLAEWAPCSPDTAPSFSAAAYFFGRELHERLKIPVGLIQIAKSNGPVEFWTPRSAFGNTIEDANSALHYSKEYAKLKKQYDKQLENWKKRAEDAKAKQQPVPPAPPAPPTPKEFIPQIGSLFETFVRPLIPYGIKGVICYQGEGNLGRALEYAKLMELTIQSWRTAWEQGDFPFYQVQLPNFRIIRPNPTESELAELREAQVTAAKSQPNCEIVCGIIPGEDRVQSQNKLEIGKRLALSILKNTYEKRLVDSGPTFKSVKFDGPKAIIQFDNIGSGLMIQGDTLKGFAIAGPNHKFVWATATIQQRDTVVLQADTVATATAVRYGWADNPDVSLYNKEGLPALPFRTDDWPGTTTPVASRKQP
ncbi:TPA: sialate O-acetylesterase [Candidatus Sumerlaeota bacterium]|nr:sialate O-acetylesterase [Candidatus Sumerlaeota bacterium]